MMQYLIDPLTKDLFNFKGRSSRKAFWMFFLLSTLCAGFLGTLIVVLAALVSPILGYIFFGVLVLYIFFAELSLTIRRYHDLDYSYWLAFIPFYNLYLLFLVSFVRGTEGVNKYGEDPTNLPSGTSNPDAASTPSSSTPVNSQ